MLDNFNLSCISVIFFLIALIFCLFVCFLIACETLLSSQVCHSIHFIPLDLIFFILKLSKYIFYIFSCYEFRYFVFLKKKLIRLYELYFKVYHIIPYFAKCLGKIQISVNYFSLLCYSNHLIKIGIHYFLVKPQ